MTRPHYWLFLCWVMNSPTQYTSNTKQQQQGNNKMTILSNWVYDVYAPLMTRNCVLK